MAEFKIAIPRPNVKPQQRQVRSVPVTIPRDNCCDQGSVNLSSVPDYEERIVRIFWHIFRTSRNPFLQISASLLAGPVLLSLTWTCTLLHGLSITIHQKLIFPYLLISTLSFFASVNLIVYPFQTFFVISCISALTRWSAVLVARCRVLGSYILSRLHRLDESLAKIWNSHQASALDAFLNRLESLWHSEPSNLLEIGATDRPSPLKGLIPEQSGAGEGPIPNPKPSSLFPAVRTAENLHPSVSETQEQILTSSVIDLSALLKKICPQIEEVRSRVKVASDEDSWVLLHNPWGIEKKRGRGRVADHAAVKVLRSHSI